MVGRKEGGLYICTYINGQQGLTVNSKRSDPTFKNIYVALFYLSICLINLLTHRPQPSLPPHCPLPPMLGNIFMYNNQYPPSLFLADLECMLATCFLQSFLHMFVLQGNNRTVTTKRTYNATSMSHISSYNN